MNSLLQHQQFEDDDEAYMNVDFYLYVDGKSILARCVELRHPEFQVSDVHWRRFSGAELWGFLRHSPIDRVLMSVTDPIMMVILMADDEESTAYVRITFGQYREFLDTYCEQCKEEQKFNWLVEGF
jgi:hypothetical protein